MSILSNIGAAVIPTATRPAYVILDTDIGGDCDDAGALYALCTAHAVGTIVLKAVTVGTNSVYAAGAAYQIMRYRLGANSIPLALYNGPYPSRLTQPSAYAQSLSQATWGTSPNASPSSYPGHVATVRTAMVSMIAAGVKGVYLSIGTFTSLAEILASPADGISSLTGVQLFAQAIGRVVTMGGNDQANPGAAGEFNLATDPAGAVAVQTALLALSPQIPHFWVSYQLGNQCMTVPTVDTTNPVSQAYTILIGSGTTRPSWDVMAAAFAMWGDRSLFVSASSGITNVIASDGTNTWSQSPGPDTCLAINPALATAWMTSTIDTIISPPAAAPTLLVDSLASMSTPAALAVSTKLIRAAYAGNPCIRVQRSSDSTTQDIGFVGSTLDESSLSAFVGSGDGLVTRWYRQDTTGGYLTPIGSPKIVIGGVIQRIKSGGVAAIRQSGANAGFTGSLALGTAAAITIVALDQQTPTSQANARVFSYQSSTESNDYSGYGSFGTYINGGAHYGIERAIVSGGGGCDAPISPGPAVLSGVVSGGILQAWNNGAASGSNNISPTSSLGATGTVYLGTDSANEYITGALAECIVMASASTPSRTFTEGSMKSRFGTP